MIDCNKCYYISITEEKQEDKRIPHICLYYRKRLFHRTRWRRHSPEIEPCRFCKEDRYEMFREKIKKMC